jgi:uncharacterized protein YecE (DUF72 family)
MAIRVGCGSWADGEYMGLLYPKAFPPDLRLCAYAMWFDYVEVNATYYAIPRRESVEQWVAQTPDSFLFDIRLPRAISQSPHKAGKEGRLISILLKSLEPLLQADKLGTFLLVLSPYFQPGRHSLEELDPLIERIQPHSLAVEFRHAAWVSEKWLELALQFFRDRKLTWVSVDMPRIEGSELLPPIDEVTQPQLAYLRLHGRNPRYLDAKSAEERHTYAYGEDELGELIRRIRHLAARAREVRVVANNHALDYAPKTALALKELLGQKI